MPDEKNTFFADWSNLMLTVNKLSKDANNPFFKSKYVPLPAVLEEAKRVCLDNNFIFIQRPAVRQDSERQIIRNILVTELKHKDGEFIKGEIEIIAKDPTDPQKVGGGITYMRRYSLTTMLGMEEQDDDANSASTPQKDTNPIPPAQRTIDNTPPFSEEEPHYEQPKKYAEKVEGAKCPDCPEGVFVKSPKTGKVFCDHKCWLSK